jgi:hypothetical protein
MWEISLHLQAPLLHTCDVVHRVMRKDVGRAQEESEEEDIQ